MINKYNSDHTRNLQKIYKESEEIIHSVNENIKLAQDKNKNLENMRLDKIGGRSRKLFNVKRNKLNTLAREWGVRNCNKYRNKQELKACLKLLQLYKKGGKLKKRNELNLIAKHLDINPKKYKTKSSLVKMINHRTRFCK